MDKCYPWLDIMNEIWIWVKFVHQMKSGRIRFSSKNVSMYFLAMIVFNFCFLIVQHNWFCLIPLTVVSHSAVFHTEVSVPTWWKGLLHSHMQTPLLPSKYHTRGLFVPSGHVALNNSSWILVRAMAWCFFLMWSFCPWIIAMDNGCDVGTSELSCYLWYIVLFV